MGHETSDIFAFVLMPFQSGFDDVYRLGIKEPADELGILAERVDEQKYDEGILERIYRQIESADIIIADMSDRNPNVFYEVGYAHAKNKLCILITTDSDHIPFDLKHRRHVMYERSISGLRTQMKEELEWAKAQIQNVRDSHIKVALQEQVGVLELTKYFAKGTVDFKIDLVNESTIASPEIEALYFYSTAGWTIYQDGKECPTTGADLDGFAKRHFLIPPLRILHKNAWAQLKFEAKKTLASGLKGDELKDTYRVRGHSVLRLVTSKGNFDYFLIMDIEFSDIPF